jgi:asparagine synthase (glutamine-hydrolysing)
MCGICGEFRFGGLSGREQHDVRASMALMSRRGPDDDGYWSDGKHCALGFRRLSILDLSPAGHQPMLTSDGRHAIVFNGEVYNFRELRQELEAQGVQFRSQGDTEVVLRSLAHWGKDALDRFNGMFALAFYDSFEKRLLLARDHAGIKPLYHLANGRCVVFGSQYDQILAHPESRDCKASPPVLSLYLQLAYIPSPYALLERTHMLEPGTWLEFTADGRQQGGKWFSFPEQSEPDLRGEEAFEAVDAAVASAVRRQLVSDVPLGTFLSGGVDSPLVAAKMRRATSGSVQAFTIGTNGDPLDESQDAAQYARQLGVEHILRHFSPVEALNMLDDVVAACGEPFADESIFPTMLVSRLARERVTVMLSGDGGDELFWGYYGRFASVLEQSEVFRLPRWQRVARRGGTRLLGVGTAPRTIMMPSIGKWYRAKHSRMFEGWVNRLFPGLPGWPEDFRLFDYAGWQPDRTAQWLRWNEFVGHLTMVLLKVDRASMYHSLEVRVPLLDREVVAVALRVDWRSCLDLDKGLGKVPLRQSLKRHVNHQTTSKRGFSVPMGEWLRGPLKKRLEEVLLGRKELAGVPFDQQAFESFYRKHRDEQGDWGMSLWVLFSLALWEQKHFARRGLN